MKYDSVVKVDNLGRIVIPKRVRLLLNVEKQDYLTLKATGEEVTLTRLDKEEKYSNIIEKVKEVNKTYNIDFILSDNNKIVYATKNYEDFKNQTITEKLENQKQNQKKTKLNSEIIINKPHHYCSIFYDNYTDAKLFIIYDEKNKKEADFTFTLLK